MTKKTYKVAYFICAIILNIASIKGFSASAGAGGGAGGPFADIELSDGGIAFLYKVEGFSTDRYLDHKKKPTIGCGHLIMKDDPELTALGYDPSDLSLSMTKEDANRLFVMDLKTRANIRNYIKGDLTLNQFDALTSLCFTIGSGNFAGRKATKDYGAKRASSTVQCIRAGKMLEAADFIVSWDNDNGIIEDLGLLKRHFAESCIYMGRDYDEDWEDISSHFGISMPITDRLWSLLKPKSRREISELYYVYEGALFF